MGGDIESGQFDIGTTSIRIVRMGDVIQLLFSGPLGAGYLHRELAERHGRAEEKLKVDTG